MSLIVTVMRFGGCWLRLTPKTRSRSLATLSAITQQSRFTAGQTLMEQITAFERLVHAYEDASGSKVPDDILLSNPMSGVAPTTLLGYGGANGPGQPASQEGHHVSLLLEEGSLQERVPQVPARPEVWECASG